MLTAIVLAAGRSERMGTQKLMLPLHGQAIIAGVVDEVLACPVDEVVVVVGRDGPQIRAALEGRDVQFIENGDTKSDMLGSVRCGLQATSQACLATLIVLGDQPGISRVVVRSLLAAFQASDKGIAIPTFGQQRGHPILISTKYREEIQTQFNDVGLRGLMRIHSKDIIEVAVPDKDVLEDIDTPRDYRRLQGRGGG